MLTVMILRKLLLLSLSALLPLIVCSPAQVPIQDQQIKLSDSRAQLPFEQPRVVRPRPLVIWHGLGDSYNSPGILEFIARVQDMHPGIFVHSIRLAETLDDDRKATFYGNVNDQVEHVAAQLANVTELAGGFDAIGFSQGGQFLRAYVERHNTPPVHNLITFGAQHMGIADIPLCRPFDVVCALARRAALRGAYTDFAQRQLVQAQYFRDPARLEDYLAASRFLAAVNNERAEERNATLKAHLGSLDKLVLVLFTKDETVVPKESSWFGAYAVPDNDEDALEKTIVPMRMQPLYREDWIGLRTLDERGAVILETCDAEHMVITEECWQPLVRRFVGGETAKPAKADVGLVVQM